MKSGAYFFLLLFLSCMNTDSRQLIVQGHRGCRGSLPENTLPAFLRAIEMGVDVLELDVVCTSDRRILISHDPFMHHEICAFPDGSLIDESAEQSLNIYQMTSDSAQSYICGSIPHPRFPLQRQIPTRKPLLSELLELAKQESSNPNRPFPALSIEIKSRPEWDGLFQPQVEEFTQLFIQELIGYENVRVSVQSFDPRILRSIHEINRSIPLTFLTEDSTLSAEQQLKSLPFKPIAYSPHFSMVDVKLVDFCRRENMELVVWTVNEEKDILEMIHIGVRNLISDYPERIIAIRDSLSR